MSVPFGQLVSQNDVTGAVRVKSGRCILAAARIFESGVAGDAYLQIFDSNAAGDITLGTTVPDWVVMLDQGVGDVSGGDGLPTHGLVFVNGIVIASTTTPTGSTTRETNARLVII